jgi:hypothetical protein
MEPSFHVSLLHCAPEFVPLYAGMGYAGSRTEWSILSWTVGSDSTDTRLGSQWSIRPAHFPQDTPQLHRLHQKYSENRLTGCIVRSVSYWNQYLSVELKGSIYVLVGTPQTATTADEPFDQQQDNGPAGRDVVAWLSIRPRGENSFQVREFGVDLERISTGAALHYLLPHALDQEEASKKGPFASNVVTISLPTFVWDEIRSTRNGDDAESAAFVDECWKLIGEETDTGWMYRVLDQDAVETADFRFASEDVDTGKNTMPINFIWPADSF